MFYSSCLFLWDVLVVLLHFVFDFLGGEGKFDVDKDSGNVFIVGRWMFELKKVYALSISAQIIGMAQSRTTPSQLLQVYVGALNPQFSAPVYNVSFYGNQSL